MVRKVCRLKYRKGEPLGLTIYPAPTFTSLPAEIRDKIYRLLLTSSEPIAVYTKLSNFRRYENDPEPREPQLSSKVATVTFGLLRVNRMVSIEAAAIFYHHNIFSFRGSQQASLGDPWDPLYSFLLSIGDQNRSRVRYLEADITRPPVISKSPDGTISSFADGSFWMRKVYAPNQYAHTDLNVYGYPHSWPTFDYVSPAIEAVFRILGSEGSKVRLLLRPELGHLPQLRYHPGGRISGWSGQIPDHIERMRRQYTAYSEGAGMRVDVQWKAKFIKSVFESRATTIEKEGWEVLEKQDIVVPLQDDCLDREGRTTCIIFRRKIIDSFKAH